jgi:hypothetical protein
MTTGRFIRKELCWLSHQQDNQKYYYVAEFNRNISFAEVMNNIAILSGG